MKVAKYGFLLFNDNINQKENIKKNKMGGVCAVANFGEPIVKTFERIKELPAGIIWFSNLKKEEVWRTGVGYIKNQDFLGISYEALSTLLFTQEDTKELKAITMASLFEETMFVYEELMQRQGKTLNLESELYEHLYEAFSIQDKTSKLTTDNDRLRLKEAYIEKIQLPLLQKNKTITFFFENSVYCKQLAVEPLPIGQWRDRIFSEGQQSAMDYLHSQKNQDFRFLVNIDHLRIAPIVGQVSVGELWLGTRGWQLNGSVISDLWLTEREFDFLKQYAQFDVKSAVLNEKKGVAVKLFTEFENMVVQNNDLRKLSLPYQCLMKSFLRAFISEGYDIKTRKKHNYTEAMVWWRVIDREKCLALALDLTENGFLVEEYGNGEIKIAVTPEVLDKRPKLVSLLLKHGALVPFGLLVEEENLTDVEGVNGTKGEVAYNYHDYLLKKRVGKKLYPFVGKLAYKFLREDGQTIEQLKAIKFTKEEETGKFKWFLENIKESFK